jgi:hypothetical protein
VELYALVGGGQKGGKCASESESGGSWCSVLGKLAGCLARLRTDSTHARMHIVAQSSQAGGRSHRPARVHVGHGGGVGAGRTVLHNLAQVEVRHLPVYVQEGVGVGGKHAGEMCLSCLLWAFPLWCGIHQRRV